MSFLYAAYAATWVIHLLYVGTLASRYLRVRKDLEELKKKR